MARPSRSTPWTTKTASPRASQTTAGIVVSLETPDRNGNRADIVLGFDSLDGYLSNPGPFFGALIGRYANRIAHARFTLDGRPYQLEKNDGENTLHGGAHGFDNSVWTPRPLPDGGLELTYFSKDGEDGFPGNLTATVTYHLTEFEFVLALLASSQAGSATT